jgi:hypothetical protein
VSEGVPHVRRPVSGGKGSSFSIQHSTIGFNNPIIPEKSVYQKSNEYQIGDLMNQVDQQRRNRCGKKEKNTECQSKM